MISNSDISINTLSRINIDNDYDDLSIVDSIKNPKITNSYSKKLFTCTVDSFGIVRTGSSESFSMASRILWLFLESSFLMKFLE